MKLSADDMALICDEAERAARAFILQRVPKKEVVDMDIFVEIASLRPFTVNVEIGLTLSPSSKRTDVDSLVKEAVDRAIKASGEAFRRFNEMSRESRSS